jgi:hypothetical protein
MNPEELFKYSETPASSDPWGTAQRYLNRELLDGLRRGPMEGISDLEVALAITQQIHDDLMAYGTGGGEDLNNDECKIALRALNATLTRLGLKDTIPFRDYTSFRSYWEGNGAYGSWAARRKIITELFEPIFTQLYSLMDGFVGIPSIAQSALSAISDPTVIQEHLRRLDSSIKNDPRLAVSVAKDLVESTAKLVLRERGFPYSDLDDLPALVSRSQKALMLHAAGITSATEEAQVLKSILGSLAHLTQGVAELRNTVGVGHGRDNIPEWIRPRHARLAAGAASTWCNLMLETLGDLEAPWRASPPASE